MSHKYLDNLPQKSYNNLIINFAGMLKKEGGIFRLLSHCGLLVQGDFFYTYKTTDLVFYRAERIK